MSGTPDDQTPAMTPADPCADRAAAADSCIPAYQGDHPIDRVLQPILWRNAIKTVEADTGEICRRLYADLLGRYPSASEIASSCANKTIDQIARDFQARDEYLLASERHWRDRLDTSDVVVDWRYLKDLYHNVDELHRGRMKYGDFAITTLVHPGFVMMEFEPERIATRVFRSFLGREPTKAEAADLGALYRPWIPAQEADPSFSYIMTIRAYLLPYLCNAIAPCTSSLFGGMKLIIPHAGLSQIRYENLDAAQVDALKDVGRLIARQPFFWEAAADEILNRLLGWSDGGRFPREPGVLIPEVRQVLASYLETTGDYPGAERLVLTSLLYRQSSHVEPDGLGDDPSAPEAPVFASGPVKPASAEVWLDSLAPLTWINIGTCDPRYPDFFAYFLMYQAQMEGQITLQQLADDMRRLHTMQDSRIYFGPNQGQLPIDEPSTTYTYVARLIGGCPGFQAPRQEASGLVFGFSQETLAEYACATGVAQNVEPPSGERSLQSVLAHQMRTVFGREPRVDELRAFIEGFNRCTGDDCTRAGQTRSICTALLGSAEMLFY
jgi:hypothetical protein